ncbi:MAG: glycosyltransferase family 2 protein [Prevotella sp.]|nr:glycosyltransferase family 2 protein [Prevotella sp.]
MMDVSIIIVNYNTTDLLLQCVSSIVSLTHGVSYEIIVVDNGSSEENLQPLRQDSRIVLLEQKENLGFGRANNKGAAAAKGRHLFLLNPDTILVNDAISILYRHLCDHEETGLCGGNIFDSEMTPIHSHDMLRPSILSELDTVLGHIYYKVVHGKNSWFNHTGKPMKVALITGADMMIRREAWDKVSGFDPSFFMYYEDSDLCVCIEEAGYDIINVPQAEIIHLEGKSFQESRSRCERYFGGRQVYFHKHYSTLYNRIADFLNISSLKAACLLSSLFGKKEKKEKYQQRLEVYHQLINKAS